MTMASKPSSECATGWKGPRIDFPTFAAQLAKRRAVLGKAVAMPRNSGTRRTESKKALLKAIEDAGGKW